MRRLSALLCAALLAAPLAAQTQNVIWSNGNSPTVGGGNAFPWGSCGLRYQYVMDMPTNVVTCLIQDIIVAADGTRGTRLIEHTDIEISMGHTAVTNATTTTNWDTNLPPANKTLVYRGPLAILHQASQWNGIGLPTPYRFLRRGNEVNLCVEIITRGIKGCTAPSNFYYPRSAVTAMGGARRAFRYNWINNQTQAPLAGTGAARIGLLCNDGNFVVSGNGCNGLQISGGPPAWPKQGQNFTVNLGGGANNAIAVLFFGLRLPTPVDLSAVAPGCTWYVNPLVIFGTATNGSGAASRILPLPASTVGVRAWLQWVNRNPAANTLGWTLSDMGTMIIGS